MTDNPKQKYRVNVTMNKKLYELLKERSREEITTMSKATKYFLLEGLKAKGYENIQEYSE